MWSVVNPGYRRWSDTPHQLVVKGQGLELCSAQKFLYFRDSQVGYGATFLAIVITLLSCALLQITIVIPPHMQIAKIGYIHGQPASRALLDQAHT